MELLLSICIPTYNRAAALKECLDSIVNSNGYDDNYVEIVVSDNMSLDDTSTIVQDYVSHYKNVTYNRNTENIGGERNFIKVLSLAKGKMLKLHNDYCYFTKNGIGDLLKISREEDERNTYVFIDSREGFGFKRYVCPDMDTFVRTECMYLSWISSFIFWKKDFDDLEQKDLLISSQFMQTDWGLRLYQKKDKHVIYFCDVFRRNTIKEKRGGFNYISVFSNFPQLFLSYYDNNDISGVTLKDVYLQVFESLLLWYYRLNIKKDPSYTYDTQGNFQMIMEYKKKYRISSIYFLLFVKVIIFDSLKYLGIQKKVRALFLNIQHKSLYNGNC